MNFVSYIGIIALLISLYVVWQIRQLVLLIFTAIVLATALNQLVKQFQRWKLRRFLAIITSFAILLIISIIFALLIIPPFIEQFQELVELLPTTLTQVEALINLIENRYLDFLELPDFNTLQQEIQPQIARIVRGFFDVFSTSINIIVQAVLVFILTLMFLGNPQAYCSLFIRLFPSFYRRRVGEILSLCEEALSSWTIGIIIEMVFITILSGIGLWILQVPLVLAHAILAGLLNFIPNLGPTLSVVFPVAIALLDAPWKAGAVLVLYIIIQQIESYWLTPTIMAKQVSLLPAVTLMAQLFFASFFGFLGLLIALPMTVIAKTWLEEILIKDFLDRWKKLN
ncbi:protein of unknown function UPF0118 [Gloeothece citriformis PCC 7424]|uniref:Permease n=1 Tax=Gloeothece citriformis (strain PCC 7424) TaxID=65393 RepID=B7KKG9_GLOC7|nr:AI-2E family transporter [Gloeothece citriformis]ACK72302.1 protein of unknown function UPF0118 [Gloeothece citriformis PCC 7424]